MDESSLKRAEFYEHKAAEARAKADGMKDLEAPDNVASCFTLGSNGPDRQR